MRVSVHQTFSHLAGDAGLVSLEREHFATGSTSTHSWALFACVCSSRPKFSPEFWGKVLQGTERLHSSKGRKASSGIAVWAVIPLPEMVEVGLHQSVCSKTSWDALLVWSFREPCLRLQVAKLPSVLLEETVTQLCASAAGEGGFYLRWIREGIFVFGFC